MIIRRLLVVRGALNPAPIKRRKAKSLKDVEQLTAGNGWIITAIN